MFVGHIAIAYAAKRARPEVSLGWYYAAVSALDLLWPIFLLAGVEQVDLTTPGTAFTPITFTSYPWSHSLLMALVWAIALGGLARRRGVSADAAKLVGALVLSHWFLDLFTHAPDLPLWPGDSPKFGLALWNHIASTYVVEGTLWLVGLGIYLSVRRPLGVKGWAAFLSFVLVSTAIWAPGPFAPPPASVVAVGTMALIGGWLSILWAAWGDRHTGTVRN